MPDKFKIGDCVRVILGVNKGECATITSHAMEDVWLDHTRLYYEVWLDEGHATNYYESYLELVNNKQFKIGDNVRLIAGDYMGSCGVINSDVMIDPYSTNKPFHIVEIVSSGITFEVRKLKTSLELIKDWGDGI